MRGSAWIGLYIVYGLVGREAASKTGASQKLQRKICSMSGRLASVVAQPEVLNSNYGDKIFRRLEIVCRAAFIAYEFIQNQRERFQGGNGGSPISTSCPRPPSNAGAVAGAHHRTRAAAPGSTPLQNPGDGRTTPRHTHRASLKQIHK